MAADAADPEDWDEACRAARSGREASRSRMPPLGSAERDRMDRRDAAMLAGLLLGYRRHCGTARPDVPPGTATPRAAQAASAERFALCQQGKRSHD